MRNILLIIFGLTSTTLSAAEGMSFQALEEEIKSKASSLLTCSVPELLVDKAKNVKPEKYRLLFGEVSNLSISDGCSVEVYKAEENQDYYFLVKGGVSGNISIVLGPISNGF